MNRLPSVLVLAAAASFFLAAAPNPLPSPAMPVDLRIEVAPTVYGPFELLREYHPDTYTCKAMLFSDEPNRRLYGRVDVIVRPGEEQTSTKTSGGLKMTIKGRVDTARTGVVAEVTVLRDGVLIARQESRVFLTRAGRS